MSYRPKNIKTWLTGVLRRASLRWPARSEALRRGRIDRGLYQCAICLREFKQREVAVDHIKPVISLTEGFTTWDDFIERLFCEPEHMQVLCHVCHNSKSAVEDKVRAGINAKRKLEEKQKQKEEKKKLKELKKLDKKKNSDKL